MLFLLACQNGLLDMAKQQLESGANVFSSYERKSPLQAVSLGKAGETNIEITKLLLDSGVDVNYYGVGYTPLLSALSRGYVEMAKMRWKEVHFLKKVI